MSNPASEMSPAPEAVARELRREDLRFIKCVGGCRGHWTTAEGEWVAWEQAQGVIDRADLRERGE